MVWCRLIFFEFGVDCDGEDIKKILHIDMYNEGSLHQMRYRKIDDKWIQRALGQGAAANSNSNDDDDDNDDTKDDEGDAPAIPSTLEICTLAIPSIIRHSV